MNLHSYGKKRSFLIPFLCCFIACPLLFGQSNMLVSVEQAAGKVSFYELTTNKRIAQATVGFKPHEVIVDPQHKRAFVTNFGVEDYDRRIGTPGSTISVIDLKTFKEVKKLSVSSDTASARKGPHGIKIRPHQQELYVNVEFGDQMLVYDLNSLHLKREFPLPTGTHNFFFSPSGDTLWLMAAENGVYQIDPANGKVIKHKQLPSPIRGLLPLSNTLLASGRNEIFLLDRQSLQPVKTYGNLGVGQIIYSSVDNDGRYIIAPCPREGMVLVIDAQTGTIVKRIATGKSPMNVLIQHQTAYISNAEDNHISLLDLQTLTIVGNIESNGPNGLAILK